VIIGVLSGLCGLLLIGQMNSADPSFGKGYELDVIAATVIGGISMTGGEGNIFGVLLGALLMGILKNMFVQLAVSGYWQTIILGVVIIGAVMIDSIRKKKAAH
jgi:ribose transport system permease protein